MLGLEVHAPFNGIFKLLTALLKQLDRLGILNSAEIAADNVLKAREQRLVNTLVKEFKLCAAVLHQVTDNILQHILCKLHIVLEVGKRYLGLHHPKLSGMARSIRLFRTEGRSEGIDVRIRHSIGLGAELTGNGEVCRLTEKVL